MRVAGTDAGIKTYDLFGFDDRTGEIFLDEFLPREEISREPGVVVERLREVAREVGGIEAIAASSGYGMPLKEARRATDADIALATFLTPADERRGLKIVGLRRLMLLMREATDLPFYFTPGVVHLPTVPEHRKANRIDLGTSDKVYTAALAIRDQAERKGRGYGETSLIAVEVGFSYTSALAVKGGKIVDAMAGTSGFPGYSGMGFVDAELCYALSRVEGELSKAHLFLGGAAHVSGREPSRTEPEDFVEGGGPGYELMVEAVVKDVASLLPSVRPEEVLLSGRFSRIPRFFGEVKRRLEGLFSGLSLEVEVRKLGHRGRAKEAAEGAAVLASGIAGGRYRKLLEAMELERSGGTLFDHLHLPGLRERLLKEFGHL
jgi:predicted butyrate kinase (DUF1464 family)